MQTDIDWQEKYYIVYSKLNLISREEFGIEFWKTVEHTFSYDKFVVFAAIKRCNSFP